MPTELMKASWFGDKEGVKLILSHGVNIDYPEVFATEYTKLDPEHCEDSTKHTALMDACFNGHDDIVEYLLNMGADVNVENAYGHTALSIVYYLDYYYSDKYIRKDKVNRIKTLLVDAGANNKIRLDEEYKLLKANKTNYSTGIEFVMNRIYEFDQNYTPYKDTLSLGTKLLVSLRSLFQN